MLLVLSFPCIGDLTPIENCRTSKFLFIGIHHYTLYNLAYERIRFTVKLTGTATCEVTSATGNALHALHGNPVISFDFFLPLSKYEIASNGERNNDFHIMSIICEIACVVI